MEIFFPYIGKKVREEVYIYELVLKVGDRMKVVIVIAISLLIGEIIKLYV